MAAGDLTTLANVEAWLKLPSGSASESLLAALISAASTFVGSYLNRNLLSATYTERYRANGCHPILLANGPVTAVTSVAWLGTTLTTKGDPIAGTAGFYISGDRTLSVWGYEFPRREMVQVVYTAGYASVPPDIQQAVNELVGEAYHRKERIGQSSKSLGGQEVMAFSQADMNATLKTILAQYKNIVPVATY